MTRSYKLIGCLPSFRRRRSMASGAVLLASVASLAALGCGGASRSGPAVVAPVVAAHGRPGPSAAPASPAAASPAEAPLGRVLSRVAVREVVAQGLGAFLQRVELDDQPVRAGGKFHGFRIAALRGERFWAGVDLRPGDVITAVNGFPIEHPEQALTAFESLEVASELRVAYDRDGQPREIAYAIADDAAGAPAR